MISQISGKIIEVGENTVTLQVGDVAYDLFVPTSVIDHFNKHKSADGEMDTFYTIQYIEGSSGHGNQFMRFVGFSRKIEKEFFMLYTSVEGVGFKTALKSLIFPIQKIALAIEKNDLATLKKLPHIGKRTAEKMVATLKGRMQKFALDQSGAPLSIQPEEDFHSEVLQVLKQVGYSESEAANLIDKALENDSTIKTAETMIQQIFKMQEER